MQFFVGPIFVALGGGNLDQYFNSNMIDFDFQLISIYFCFIFYWSGHVEVQMEAHAKVAPFLSFKR